MENTKVYVRVGVPTTDLDSMVGQQNQGLQLLVRYKYEDGTWVTPWLDKDGNDTLGYKGVIVDEEEGLLWLSRVKGAAESSAVAGYTDGGGTWFAGVLGRGVSVIDKAGFDNQVALFAARKTAFDIERNRIVSSRQFNQGLILKGLDDQAEAVVYGLPDATPQEIIYKKVVTNWYLKSNQFESKNPVLVQFAPMLGFDTTEKLNAFFDYCATL